MITEQSVREEIYAFRDRLPAGGQIYVGVLRYGAHLPHLWDDPRDTVETSSRPRVQLILSHMLDFLPPEIFQGTSHFVVLDDTVYRGRQMEKHVGRLNALGVSMERITTAAVVVHEKSRFTPTIISRKLNDREYVQWKDCFTKLVRTQLRSTDRDHPLYFFEVQNLSSGQLLSILETFGNVASIDDSSYGPVYAFAVNMDSRTLLGDLGLPVDLWNTSGIEIEDLCKIRLYWEEYNGKLSLTLVPIVFCTIASEALIQTHGDMFANFTGIPLSALDYLKAKEDSWGRFAFFLLSRAIASKVLEAFLIDFTSRLKTYSASIKRLDAEERDLPVSYVFPDAYVRCYGEITKRIDAILDDSAASDKHPLFFSGMSAKVKRSDSQGYASSGLPRKYDVVKALCQDDDPAMFDGREWLANDVCSRGVTFSTLVSAVRDPLLVSCALDDLLDSGLLRAGDGNVAALGEQPKYSRIYLPGGEFNVVLVSRLALSCRTVPLEEVQGGRGAV